MEHYSCRTFKLNTNHPNCILVTFMEADKAIHDLLILGSLYSYIQYNFSEHPAVNYSSK